MNAATEPAVVPASGPASVLTAPPPAASPAVPLPGAEPEPLLVPVRMSDLRPAPPPPPRTATVPAVRVGVAVAALGGLLLLAGVFAPPWYGVREISVRPPPQTATAGGGNGNGPNSGGSTAPVVNSFTLRTLTQEVREQGAVTWASTRFEKRTAVAVGIALAAQSLALMSLVSLTWWRPLVSLAGMFAAALPAVACADLLNLTNVVQRRYVGMIVARGLNTNGQPIPVPDLVLVGVQPGLGMNVLFVGAGVAVLGTLIALVGGRRSRVLAHMPKHP